MYTKCHEYVAPYNRLDFSERRKAQTRSDTRTLQKFLLPDLIR